MPIFDAALFDAIIFDAATTADNWDANPAPRPGWTIDEHEPGTWTAANPVTPTWTVHTDTH
jgi:hypothetical protein